ncbi:GNAT family N-acetyltransferase [Gracilibacillus caseinilyticus]|uniref:GNAT family N-acetyltransferase n=1 Tax=Gracilibacillus caseinilyticus TaxID=2932256 RepID=A0ABY4ES03_9BACI|nr:GNAT family N-acetyltransferase [Gracilibacillus caseinilyticus]UOQ46846.1 GNAT family N-acetyltransferase [Gracilibacillus caseinilyticus]
MIAELNKQDFYKCKDLVNNFGQLEILAIINGVNPGRIFVDNPETPGSGVVWQGNKDGFVFFGNEQNEEFNSRINYFIDNVIEPQAKRIGLDWFEAIGNHEGWNKVIEKIFEHRDLGDWDQRVYVLDKNDYIATNKPNINKEYTVHKINKGFYETNQNSLSNFDFLRSKLLGAWSSLDNFFNSGIGYCIVYNNAIVSICHSEFAVDNVHCIAIETVREHQGKKLAQKVAHRFVTDCLDKGMVPYWDCMEVNKASIALAENIGFRKVFDYKGYDFKL